MSARQSPKMGAWVIKQSTGALNDLYPLHSGRPPVAPRAGSALQTLVLTDGVEESGRGSKSALRADCVSHRGFNRCFSKSDTPDTLRISLNQPSRPSSLFIGCQVMTNSEVGATSRSPLEWTSLGIAQWSKLRRPFCTYEPTRLSFIPVANKLSHTPGYSCVHAPLLTPSFLSSSSQHARLASSASLRRCQ